MTTPRLSRPCCAVGGDALGGAQAEDRVVVERVVLTNGPWSTGS